MKKTNNRIARIASQIQEDVVVILRKKLHDPRISAFDITINDVDLDDHCTMAKIYWSVLDDEKIIIITQVLNLATKFIRSELSKGFKTYTIPQIKFIYDKSLIHGMKLLDIIDHL